MKTVLLMTRSSAGFWATRERADFIKEDESGNKFAFDLQTCDWRSRQDGVPDLAARAEKEGLGILLEGDDNLSRFAWNVLARVLTYSASLLPDVTSSPQDIDDAMKLGYNWVKGPFELVDEIGSGKFVERLEREKRHVPEYLRSLAGKPVYAVEENKLKVRQWGGDLEPVRLPDGVVRFHLLRQTLRPVNENASASLFHLDGGIRLVEFHTKANALDSQCMEIVKAAAADPGPGIIVHNDAQHFSAGVNLERFLEMIEAENWSGIDSFLIDFQEAVAALRYCPAPVVGAPSGLAIGGGYEVLVHCDAVVAHTNTVLGLVESVVGLVPGGGGVKETYWRWYQKTGDWQKAARNTFNQVGYGQTASSPDEAADLMYFLPERDRQVMNRDRLVESARKTLAEISKNYAPRNAPEFVLAGGEAYDSMVEFLKKGVDKGVFFPHDLTVGSAIARIVTGGESFEQAHVDEKEMFARERASFLDLAKTQPTVERVRHLLNQGTALRN